MCVGQERKLIQTIRLVTPLIEDEQFTKAFNLLKKFNLKELRPSIRLRLLRLKTQCLVKVGNIEAAKEQLDETVYQYPDDGGIHNLAARFYQSLKDMHRANKSYLRAVCLAPDNASYAISYSRFLQEKNSMALALRVLNKYLRTTKPDSSSKKYDRIVIYQELAHIYFRSQRYGRASFFYLKCRNVYKNFVFHDHLAESLLYQEQYEMARDVMTEHFSLWGSNDPESLYLMAKIQSSLGNSKEAIDCLCRCLQVWSEIVITPSDAQAFAKLIQTGEIKQVPNTVFTV